MLLLVSSNLRNIAESHNVHSVKVGDMPFLGCYINGVYVLCKGFAGFTGLIPPCPGAPSAHLECKFQGVGSASMAASYTQPWASTRVTVDEAHSPARIWPVSCAAYHRNF